MKRAAQVRHDSDETDTSAEGLSKAVRRRAFIQVGTLGAAAAGLVASVPSMSTILAGASEDAPAVTGAATEAETVIPQLDGPIIAHVTDVSSGSVSVYVGEQEITFQDPSLVHQLLRQTAR
jgi:hypothetical protein